MSMLWIVLLIVCSVEMIDSNSSVECRNKARPVLDACKILQRRKAEAANLPNRVQRDTARRKRQIMSIREIVVSSRVPMYDIPYPPVSSYVGYETAPVVPPIETDVYGRPQRFDSLPEESHSQVGFDPDMAKVAELLYGVIQRMPRSYDGIDVQRIQKCCAYEDLSCKCLLPF